MLGLPAICEDSFMSNFKKSQNVYNYVVIGSGLAGLCVANALSKITQNMALIESADTYGGINRSINTPLGPVNNGLRFLPDTESSQKALSFLEVLINTPLQSETMESHTVTYDSGSLKPFVGFGNNPPEFYEDLSYFLAPKSLHPILEPHEWTQMLFSQYTGEFLPRSYVTKFHQENGRVTHLTVNGQKTIHAENFIFCGPVKSLKQLLPEGILNSRSLSKLAKNNYWTAVGVDFLHGLKVSENLNMHLLNGTTVDEIGPCIGQFQKAEEMDGQTKQYSQWLTFVSDEEAEDSEVVGAALKKIKRQIKRAYPQAFEKIDFERIIVAESISGNGELKVNGQQNLPGLENLWIGSTPMNLQRNLVGALLQAELIVSALGCHPLQTHLSMKKAPPVESQEII